MQVFVPSELAGPEPRCLPGLAILSRDEMCPAGGVETCKHARISTAASLIRQWFGCLLVAAAPADEWLIYGLQGYVLGVFVMSAYGASELTYMRMKERDAVRAILKFDTFLNNTCKLTCVRLYALASSIQQARCPGGSG